MPQLNLNGLAIKKALWITDHLRREMDKRDFLKKKAMLDRKKKVNSQPGINTNEPGTRQITKLRKANVKYFIDNLELTKSNPEKIWYSINELSSRRSSKAGNISEIEIAKQITT